MLDPPPLGAAPGVGGHLGGQGRVQLSPEEAQDVFGRERRGRVREQLRQDRLQGGPGHEGEVGGDLDLVGYPVVAAEPGSRHRGEMGVDHAGQAVEQAGPAAAGETVGQALGQPPVVAADQGVGVAQVPDPAPVELAGQPFPPVGPHLDLEREPALQAHMAETQLGMGQVEVEVQALATPAQHLQALGLAVVVDVETAARLHGGEHADQAIADPVALGDLAGQFLLRLASGAGVGIGQVQVGAARLRGEPLGVGLELIGHRLDVTPEVLQQHVLGVE